MATNDNTKKIGFVQGEMCRVWKPTGVRNGKTGPATSERLGQDYPDIQPNEDLLVLTKYGTTKALVERASRKGHPDHQLIVHINHINPSSGYYANRKDPTMTAAPTSVAVPSKKLTPAEALAKATAEAEAAMARLLQMQKEAQEAAELAAIADEIKASPEIPEAASVLSARDEAAALFGDGEDEYGEVDQAKEATST